MIRQTLCSFNSSRCSPCCTGDSGAKVLIVEAVPADGVDGRAEVLRRDVNMLVMTGGQLRSASQWRPLLADAGLALRQVSATRSAWSVVEASVA